jgi:holliday junction DNA helicase RuvA
MISYLAGTIFKIRQREIILLVSGVGYQIFVTEKTCAEIKINATSEFWIFTHQTADSTALFGFQTERELKLFELFIAVNKVGPKTALEILETPVETLENLIEAEDAEAFARIKGIGTKTASRIVLELRGKLVSASGNLIDQEVYEALERLGFKKVEIKKRLEKLPNEIKDSEKIVEWFLRESL